MRTCNSCKWEGTFEKKTYSVVFWSALNVSHTVQGALPTMMHRMAMVMSHPATKGDMGDVSAMTAVAAVTNEVRVAQIVACAGTRKKSDWQEFLLSDKTFLSFL